MWKRHNPFYIAALAGIIAFALALFFAPLNAYVVETGKRQYSSLRCTMIH